MTAGDWRIQTPGRFIVGVNLPWVGYGTDVGRSAWFPEGGLSVNAAALDRLDRTLATIASDGFSVVRTFLLCDLRSGVIFGPDGVPQRLDDNVFPDIDALLSAIRRHGLRLMPVLLDFHVSGARQIVNGVQLGGRSWLMTDAGAREACIDRVLRPIAERYAADAAVFAWDVINEPEWCLRGGLFSRTAVPFDALQEFLRSAVRCVQESAAQPVTIGCAGTWRLDLVKPLGLDFYQVHWYDRFGWDALSRPLAELGLHDRPVILGEFAGRSARINDVLETARRAGYEGALVWSALADDEQSDYPAELREWARAPPES